ncbi:maternal effect embryo arrest 45 [Hibiscus trionum]|uniref:Maternal effect embryo arrest 45 n=1 Tax=Hibiscus trionum TaxID=183268 RepID=A0A9W7HZW7_HIBTR|nr:maternal effect embryo arrest 45 [Hibiscus trionum]
MARKPKRSPSFFKVLIGDFGNKLRIPPAFVKYIFKGNAPSIFTLYSDSRNLWRARVEIEQGNYFISGGWSKFAKHHRLETGDFLVFFLVDSSMFDVIIYNRTACEKNVTLAANTQNGETPSKRSSSVSKNARPVSRVRNVSEEEVSFTMVVKDYQKYYIFIPRRFAREAGIGKENTTIVKGPRGDMWPMNTTLNGKQFRLGGGWSQFVHENGIVVGDTLLFQHIPNTGNSVAVHVQIVNKKAHASGKSTKLASKRGRGRPRSQTEEAPSSTRTKGVNIGGVRDVTSNDEIISEQASFSMVLKKYQAYSVVVPSDFVEEMGLAEKRSTVLKDSKGRTWALNIVVVSKSNVLLGAGWSAFVKGNKLGIGDTLWFQHIPNTGNVINFKLISKAGGGNSRKRNKRANVF